MASKKPRVRTKAVSAKDLRPAQGFRKRQVGVRVDSNEYAAMIRTAKAEGHRSLSEFVRTRIFPLPE